MEVFRRALLKKLRHVDELKRKQAGGETLDEQQLAKLSREPELLASLSQLEQRAGGAEVHSSAPSASTFPSPSPSPSPFPSTATATATSIAAAAALEVGAKLLVDGRKAKVKRIDTSERRVKVKFRDDKSVEWVPQASGRLAAAAVAGAGAPPPPLIPPPAARCAHCGDARHEARLCSFGLAAAEQFLPCGAEGAARCFSRTFIVPLRRARAAFDVDDLRDGRVDVGLRCVSSALFRSQSLRRNTQLLLCFGGEQPARLVGVLGSMVRDLRPDEKSLALRVRAVSDAEGAAAAAAELERARRENTAEAIGSWSRSATRGWTSCEGDILAALEKALAVGGAPPTLLLLSAAGRFIGDVCGDIAAAAAGGPTPGVVVLLGDDRGLTGKEEADILAAAGRRGSAVRRVSLGEDMLFASHAIVIVHHYLDRLLHSCRMPPPRIYARGGGSKGKGSAGRSGRGSYARGRGKASY
ncbi:hypothetical protein AB1Y20_018192 [Prymnesium parvum]|uniref:16S rRNA (uracil(1498)-N(3))-methyltransferase n=1 Tax=Prymnesium parvum TaxID=97485 RepID=A0AB34JNX5_PRYPA